MSRPRAIAMLATAAVAVALGGCGKGGSPRGAQAGTQTATASQPGAPKPGRAKPPGGSAVSPARADAFARAVNLTAADLPGFARATKARSRETPAERDLQRKLARCTGGRLEGPTKNTERSSGQFRRRGNAFDVSVGSAVTFLRSASLAVPELQALRSSRTSGCLRIYLNERFSGQHFGAAAIRRVSVVQGTPPAPGTAGGFGWRITAVIELRRLRVPFYLDILGFVRGSAEVALTSSSLLVPFPAEQEERLYRLLLGRARAHKL